MKDPDSVERLTRIRELFEEVSGLPVSERSAFLDQACGEDMDLRADVTSLLLEAEAVESPFEDLVNDMIWPALKSLSGDASKLQGWLDDCLDTDFDETDPLIGKSVSRFDIIAPVGQGGMGMVYRAHDRTLDRTVALKFLPPSLSTDRRAKDRFIHEAKAASGLDHPNIATVYEIGETGDRQLFIAMGYYPGETLKEKIEKAPISSDSVIDYAIQLTSGMKDAHGHGVIHRDIKPGNIMITTEGTAVLLDFGLAKLSYETGYTQVGQMAGTIAYMSPEQARGEAIDQRTDIWSCGVVLYEMLTGNAPFGGENAQVAIRSILEEDPEPPTVADEGIPESLKTILGLCLAKDPAHRYQSADDLLTDLRRAREGLAPMRRGRRATWKRRWRRGRLATLCAGVTVLSIAAFLILRYWPAGSRLDMAVESGPELDRNQVAAGPPEEVDRGDEAIQVLKNLLKKDPENVSAVYNLAFVYDHSRSQYDEAMVWYRRAHALEPLRVDIPSRMAELYVRMGDPEVATWWMERTLAIAPESLLSDSLRVKIHLLRGDVVEALELFQSRPVGGMDSAPDTVEPLLEALLDKGESEQALALCKQSDSPYLKLHDSNDEPRAFGVIDDPFGLDQGRVAEMNPGEFTADSWNGNSEIFDMGLNPYQRRAIYRLPELAQIRHPASGPGKSTLYFKVGRPGIDGRPGEADIVWGLATAAYPSDSGLPSYADFSVQGRYQPDGIMDIRDGGGYSDLTEFSLETDTYYELWFVIDHAGNTYDLHLRGGSRFPQQTLVYTGAKYRKMTRAALDHFVLITTTGGDPDAIKGSDPVYFDDIYIDPQRENLGNPDTDWILIDDFEVGEASNWLVRLRREERVLKQSKLESAFLVARVLHANGEEDRAENILHAIETAVEGTGRPDWNSNIAMLTRIHAIRGERDQAMAGMHRLIDTGQFEWFSKDHFETDEFTKFAHDPEFRDLMSQVYGIMATCHSRIREMEARGRLAPIPLLPHQCRASAQVSFTRITEGDLVENMAGVHGMAWGDYDGDGFVDVALARGDTRPTVHLYHNNGDGTFHRETEGIPVTDLTSAYQPAWADQDNDGDLDLFVSTWDDLADSFYRNEGGGIFARESEGDWVNTPTTSSIGAWGDYDNDGFVDLYVTVNRESNLLFHNRGDGTMERIDTEAFGMDGWTDGCIWSDYDGDGDVDLFVGGQNRIQFRNDGDGAFSWVPYENGGIPHLDHDLSFSSADYDNDGDLDLLYNTWKPDQSSQLYRNEGEAGFVDVTRIIPGKGATSANGSSWGDYDNDGFLDLFIPDNNGSNLLYHNEGDGSFTRIIEGPVVSGGVNALRSAWVDTDNDGDLDLVMTSGSIGSGEPKFELYRNEGGTGNWIALNLVGTASNRSAIGAKVRARATINGQEVTQLRQVGGYGKNPADFRAHFGLGDATTIDILRVEWPSGHVQELRNVTVNQFLTIREDTAAEAETPR